MKTLKRTLLSGSIYTFFMWMVYTLMDYRDAEGMSFQEVAIDKIPIALVLGVGFTIFLFVSVKIYDKSQDKQQ